MGAKESNRTGPRPSRRSSRRRDGSEAHSEEVSEKARERLPAASIAGLLVFVAAVSAAVIYLLVYGGVSPQERERRKIEEPIGPLPTGDPPPLAAAGRLVYERHCQSCHGERLSGGIGPNLRAKRYDRSRWSDQDLANVIYGGTGSMPAFRDTLAAGELAAVVAYIRWEQGLPLPQVSERQAEPRAEEGSESSPAVPETVPTSSP